MDILCQAKSGMGKTAVFVLATLQQIEPVDGQVSAHVEHLSFMCWSKESIVEAGPQQKHIFYVLKSWVWGLVNLDLMVSFQPQLEVSNWRH